LELRNAGQTSKMGCSLADRHNFLLTYEKDKDKCFIPNLKEILRKTDVSCDDKYDMLKCELEKLWDCQVYKFDAVKGGEDCYIFEVLVDYDQFTICIPASASELKRTVVEYFYDMLQIGELPDQSHQTKKKILEDVTIYPF
jgi:hypothetical protein